MSPALSCFVFAFPLNVSVQYRQESNWKQGFLKHFWSVATVFGVHEKSELSVIAIESQTYQSKENEIFE